MIELPTRYLFNYLYFTSTATLTTYNVSIFRAFLSPLNIRTEVSHLRTLLYATYSYYYRDINVSILANLESSPVLANSMDNTNNSNKTPEEILLQYSM